MSAILRGQVTAANRAGLIAEARTTAEAYFGAKCLDVVLRNEATVETESTWEGKVIARRFGADFSAKVRHELQQHGSYGPATCRDCGAPSYPNAPLHGARLPAEEGDRA